MTTKVVSEHNVDTISCPGCQAKIEIERDKPTHRIMASDSPDVLAKLDNLEKQLQEKARPQVEKAASEKVLPSFVPGYVCKDCGEVHKNKGYRRKAKFKCDTPDCGQFSGSDNANCPWCGKRDWVELDDDTKEMLPDPNAKDDHEHDD